MNKFRIIRFNEGSDYIYKEIEKDFDTYNKKAEQIIKTFEKDIGNALPKYFRLYLKELETVVSYIAGKDRDSDSKIWEYMEYISFPKGRYKDIFVIGDLYSINEKATNYSKDFFLNEGKKNLLPIANNGSGDYLTISLTGADSGKLFRWNHEYPEDDEQKVTSVANSFKDFLAGLG